MKRLVTTMAAALMAIGSSFGQAYDNLPDPIQDVNHVVDNTPDSIAQALMSRPAPGSTRKGNNPVLFLIGNSTMRNGTKGDGSNGQWGWGFCANKYYNGNKISVENQALGGMSTRTFYNQLWPAIRQALKPGDWVIVSIGHNDNGPFFSGRARAVIPGYKDSMMIGKIQETGKVDTVYSYGSYLRKYIAEIRAKGANPILMSLTPRYAYDEKGKIVRKSQTEWAAYVAAEEGVPFVDLNDISGAKLDKYGKWKAHYHFYGDQIHSSIFGAEMNARSAAEGIYYSHNPLLRPLQAMMVNVPLDTVAVQSEQGKAVVFITGDSTVKNADKDKDGMWGWGSQANTVFDARKITAVNVAKAGRSTRSYLREGRWEQVYNSLRPGDFVLLEFGHNDICPIADKKERGVLPGTTDTCHVYKMENDGRNELVYSFGWYLKKFIQDVREKGATPILVSLTPRNEWPAGKIERRNDSYGKWYREVVDATGVEFVDLHNISGDFLDKKFASKKEGATKEEQQAITENCKAKAAKYFNHDHTHTSLIGAQMNAQSVAKGLKQIHSPLADYLK